MALGKTVHWYVIIGMMFIVLATPVYAPVIIGYQNEGQNESTPAQGDPVELHAQGVPATWFNMTEWDIDDIVTGILGAATNMTSLSDNCCIYLSDVDIDKVLVFNITSDGATITNILNYSYSSSIDVFDLWTNSTGQAITDWWVLDRDYDAGVGNEGFIFHMNEDFTLSSDPYFNVSLKNVGCDYDVIPEYCNSLFSNVSSGNPEYFWVASCYGIVNLVNSTPYNISRIWYDYMGNYTAPTPHEAMIGLATNDTDIGEPQHWWISDWADVSNNYGYIVELNSTFHGNLTWLEVTPYRLYIPEFALILKNQSYIDQFFSFEQGTDLLYRFVRGVVDYAVLSTNETGSWENKSTYNSPMKIWSNNTEWSNFTWDNSSISEGTVIAWRIYYNTTLGYENVTSEQTFTISGDITSPTWSNNQTSYPSDYESSTESQFNVTWDDDMSNPAFDVAFFESNHTGSLTNYTASEDGNVSYYGIILGVGTYNFSFYANDSSNNWNQTDYWTITIDQASQTCSVTNNLSTTISYPDATNISGTCTGTSGNLYRWDQEGAEESVSNPFEWLHPSNGTRGYRLFNYTFNTTGNDNYSSATYQYNLTVNAAGNDLVQYFNGNANQNLNIESGDTLNVTTVGNGTVYIYMDGIEVNNSGGANELNVIVSYENSSLVSGNMYYFSSNATGGQNVSGNSVGVNYSVSVDIPLAIYDYDEETNSSVTFNVTISNSTFSVTEYNQNPYQSNISDMPFGDITITYWAETYPQRKRYTLISNDSSMELNIYSLNSTDGHTVSFYIVDSSENPINNVLVTAWRQFGSDWLVVDQERSDDSGIAQLFLRATQLYMLRFNRTGYSDVDSNITPSESSYKVYMTSLEGYTGNYTPTMWENLTFAISPQGGAVRNETTTFNFTLISSDSTLEWWGMNITHSNGTVLYSNNTTSTDGGIMEYTVNLAGDVGTNITLTSWFKKQGFNAWIDPRIYFVQGLVSAGLYWVLTSLGTWIDPFSLGLIALLCSMMAAGMVSTKWAFGSKLGGGVIMLGVLAIFTYFLEATLWGWLIWAFAAVSVASLLYLKGGW